MEGNIYGWLGAGYRLHVHVGHGMHGMRRCAVNRPRRAGQEDIDHAHYNGGRGTGKEPIVRTLEHTRTF